MTDVAPGAPIADFAEFGRRMINSWDIDPVYPVLKQLIEDLGLGEAEADWLTVLYLAYYELSSAVTAFMAHPDPRSSAILGDYRTLKLPTGIERRGLRKPEFMREHLQDWLGRFDGRSFFTAAWETFRPTPEMYHVNNDVLDAYLRGVKFNGRWAAYKGCEVMQKVRGYPNAARDAGHENSTGPRAGLGLFFPPPAGNSPEAIRRLNVQTDTLIAMCEQHGLLVEVEEVETLLCDFSSLRRARYYVGHDIDLLLEGIHKSPPHVQPQLWEARRALPEAYLGEKQGWSGVDRELCHRYADTGEIGDRAA
jgi:hypothetical protein